MSSKNTDGDHLMYSKNENIEIAINDKADEVTEELFQSLLFTYKIGFETSIKGSSFIFDHVQLLYYKCQIINRNRDGSNIDSPD